MIIRLNIIPIALFCFRIQKHSETYVHLYIPLSINLTLEITKLEPVMLTLFEFFKGVLFLYHLITGVGNPSAVQERVILVPTINDAFDLSSVIWACKRKENRQFIFKKNCNVRKN